ncbi:MAG TPA: hypothetical protein VHS06_11895 [Chloroflexota bacterium]|nr:hypothetical protein [Chloroflexota bacterium]
MAEEQTYLLDANAPAQQMLHDIDEARAADEPDLRREHIQLALDAAQSYADDLDSALTTTEDPDLSDRIEEAVHHLDMAIEQGEAAIDAPDEDLEEYLSTMDRHAEQSYARLQEAVGAAEQ